MSEALLEALIVGGVITNPVVKKEKPPLAKSIN
jgi:hypothetical protein